MALFVRLPNLLRICRPQLPSLHLFVQHAAQPLPCLARVSFRPGLSTAIPTRLAAARIAVRNLFTVPTRDVAAIYKKAEEGFTRKHIKVLPNRPTHVYQPRDGYVKLLDVRTKTLRHGRPNNVVVAAYVKGETASGKTQVAREFGEKYFEEKTVKVEQTMTQHVKKIVDKSKRVTVSTLYARSESAFLRSYFRLAVDLDCPLKRLNSATTEDEKLTLYQAEIQQMLRRKAHQDWLLVVDGMTTEMMQKYHSYLPQPGSTDWGRGVIVVTTTEDRIIQRYSDFVTCIEIEELSEEDAVTLLRRVSGHPQGNEKHLKEIIKSSDVKKYPLDVVSAGLHIRTTGCSFESYLQQLPHSHSKASRIKAPGSDYPDTLISAIAEATRQIAKSDDCLEKVFTVFAAAPHEPIPEDVIHRFLELNTTSCSEEIAAAVKNCGFISRNPEWKTQPQDSHDTVATLHVHLRTLEALREVFPRNDETNEIVQQFVRSLLQEFEKASSDTAWTRQLLFPHLKGFQDGKKFALDRNIRVELGVALSNAYIDLNENPHRAREVLSNLLETLDEEKMSLGDLTPRERAMINSGLGKAYRHLGQYEKSIKSLTQALDEKDPLKPTEVADMLKEFCSTIPSYGEYMESRELLKSALAMFKDDPEKYLSTRAEALSGLAYLCSKMGDWKDGKEYLRKAEKVLSDPKYLATSSDAKYGLTAKENLAVAYSELGRHKECIKLLQDVRDQVEKSYGDNHPALAVPLARLSAAHYYNRERDDSQKLAETVLKMKRSKSEVYIPWNALQILGTTACDFGDVARGNDQELIDRIMDYKMEQAEWSVASELLRGRVHRLLGDIKQAQWTLEGALKESERVYGSNHIRVGRVLTELGKVYQEQWYLTRALEAFQRSHSIHKKFYGDQGHLEVAFIQGDRAIILHRAGDQDNGLTMMEDALVICKNNLDPISIIRPACMHVKYAQMLTNYGVILRDMRQPRKLKAAREPLEMARQILNRDLSGKSIIGIRNEYVLGTVHHGLALYVTEGSEQQEDYEKAQKHMQKALNLIDSVGLKHPYRATISTGLARLRLDREQYSQAEYHAKQALDMLTDKTKFRDEIHPHVGYCYQILGDVAWLGESHDPICAHDNYLKALMIYLSLIVRETTQASDHKIDLDNVTIFETWKRRLEKIKGKLHDVAKKMKEMHT